MKRHGKSFLVWILSLIALCVVGLGVFVWAMEDYGARIAPPGKDVDKETFFSDAKGPTIIKSELFLHEGRQYSVMTGKIPNCFSSWIVLPSGPPVYIFDDSGKLSDWVADSGESSWLEQWIRESKLLATTYPE
jgi:hypothetical protein